MSSALQPDPSMIGGVSKAPFAKLPDPAALFGRRAARLRSHAGTAAGLAPFLGFLGGLVEAQSRVLPGLPPVAPPAAEALRRAHDFAMPPIDRADVAADPAFGAVSSALFAACAEIAMPSVAATALAAVRAADAPLRARLVAAVMSPTPMPELLAEQTFIAAAVQVHLARLAAALDDTALVPLATGVCPACGGAPAVSLIAGWHGAEGARYASCSLCGTLWNEVRVKCLACGATEGIGYQEVEGGAGTIKAETCDSCGSYVKLLYQNKDTALEPVADDVASLGLDLLMRTQGKYVRAGANPFLAGH